jgi:hypothetical protein
MRLTPTDLESLLPADHPARAIWAVVEKMDLSKFEATIAAREALAGEDVSARRQAARERAAKERLDRVERALAELPKVREAKKEKARVSTTDPEARVMKMGDGGFRPAYNAQFAMDTQTRVIVGVEVTPVGNDMGQMPPMLQDVKERHGQLPAEYRVVDGGFAQKESIEQAAQAGGLPGGGGLAPADGDDAGQRDLQAESGHRGDDQRRFALQPCLGSISGARPSQSEVRDPVGRPDLQHPEADRGGVDQGLRAVGIEGNTRGRPGK